MACEYTPSTLYQRPLQPHVLVITHLATSVTANVFWFYDHLHQVCRPAKRPGFSFHGYKYLTSFLKLDLDFGSKCRAPTLVKHATPVPKRAQHSHFSSSYPFDLLPCIALLVLRLLYHSVANAE